MERKSVGEALLETLDPKGRHVVDVGSGDGAFARFLAKHGAHVTGIECGPLQLEKALAATKVADERYIDGVGQALPCADGAADLVTFINSLHHVPATEMDKALAEAARVLKDGGDLFVAEPLAEGAGFELAKPVDDETVVRAAAYAAMSRAGAHGLEAVREWRFDMPRRIPRFEDFRDTMISTDPSRRDKVAAMDDILRKAFAALATPVDGGFEIVQPMRVNLFRRKARV